MPQRPARIGASYALYGPFTEREQTSVARRNRRFAGRAATLEEATQIACELLDEALDQPAAFVQLYDVLADASWLAAEMTHASRPDWLHNEHYREALDSLSRIRPARLPGERG